MAPHSTAQAVLERAVVRTRAQGTFSNMTTLLVRLASVLAVLERPDEARATAHEALGMASRLQMEEELADCRELLAQLGPGLGAAG